MEKMLKTLSLLFIFIVSFTLCGCDSQAKVGGDENSSSPEVIIQGDTLGKEKVQTIEIDNCDGKGDVIRTEQRTQSVDVTISTDIAAKIGASAEVISAEAQAAVGATTTQSGSRSMSIQLIAPPNTHMQYQILWTGKEQIGVVQNLRGSNVPIAFRGFIPTDVRIKSQIDVGCSNSENVQEVIQPTSVLSDKTYDCLEVVSASRELIKSGSGDDCWLKLSDGSATDLYFNDSAQITYRTASGGNDVYFYVAQSGDKLTKVIGATIRPIKFVNYAYGGLDEVKEFEINYHSPGFNGGWETCLRDANNDFQPLNDLCK